METEAANGDMNGHEHVEGHDDHNGMQTPPPLSAAAPHTAGRIIEVPLATSELLEINLDELAGEESIGDIVNLFVEERTPVLFWIKVLDEYHRRGRLDIATTLGEAGVAAFRDRGDGGSTVPLLCMMASYQMQLSRSSPKTVLPNPRMYNVKGQPKQHFLMKATALVTQAEAVDARNGFVLDTKANLYLLSGKFDDAFRTYEHILTTCPGHLFAIMGKARILYVRRQFRASLKLYQSVLSASPAFLPDPRIGIGLCFWNLGDYHLARRAWERSRVVNEGKKESTGASLLLGLSWLNVARETRLSEEERVEAYSRGIQFVQEAWKNDKTCAATAAALAGYFLTSNNQSTKWDTVIKLAELAIQHGDSRAIISEGQLAIARSLHAQGRIDEATRHYVHAMEANPDQTVAALGLGQMYILKKDYPAAVNTYENVLRKQPRSIEAMVSLASIHARSALLSNSTSTGTTASTTPAATGGGAGGVEANSDKSKSRELFDQVVNLFQGTKAMKDTTGDRSFLDPLGPRIQQVARDPDLYVEIARLWTGDDSGKSLSAYRQSLQVRKDNHEQEQGQQGETADEAKMKDGEEKPAATTSKTPKDLPPQLLCNIGCLEYGRGEMESAQERFEEAITLDVERQQAASSSSSASGTIADGVNGASNGMAQVEGDAVLMTVMYNLGIVMEARGQKEEAIQLYEGRLLARHPEFIEAKARLAALALADKQHERCSDFLKAALTAQPGHLDIRALYTYFLIEVGNPSAAKDFAVMTLKDFNKTDVYAMSAMAHLLYAQARENRDSKPEAVKDRISRYFRACEAFDRVLQLDPGCAYAAQGLAIALAEGNLGGKLQAGTAQGQSLATAESAQRARNLRDALSIFTKVREIINSGNVYVNIGLCHFLRDEYERSIEMFETANNRFYQNTHLPTLLYLARARFHKANKDSSFTTLQASLQCAQSALALAPNDDAIRFNISLIQQKGLELLQSLPAAKRRVTEIQTALSDAEAAQETFASLAGNKQHNLTYSTDLADQRRRYGEGLVKRAPATLKEQEAWEHSEQNKIEMAKRDREAERARQAEVERLKREEARREADELAARRKQMIEDSKSWYVKPVEEPSDDEEAGGEKKKGKGKGRKKKGDADDGIVPDGEGEEEAKPKKRKKAAAAGATGEGQAKRKRKPKKGAEQDENDGNVSGAAAGSDAGSGASDAGPKRPNKRKKQFRTKDIISDSDVSD